MQPEDINSRQNYIKYIKEMADCMEEEWENYPEDNRDYYHEIHMEVDYDPLHTYYSHNLTVLEHSPKEPEEWKHLVSETDGYRKVIQAMAFDVMRRDLAEELENRGFDV